MTKNDLPRTLVLMGSGETAPPMVKPHRTIFELLDPSGDRNAVDAVMVETPFGFQENAPTLTDKTLEYFDQSVGRTVVAAGLLRTDTAQTVAIEQAISRIRTAEWLFTGPGSPSFALRQWKGSPVPGAFADKLRTGGVVLFSSAAVLTVGLRTVPVYEVYKVGEDPFWLEGLDLLSTYGLPVTVIPHYDNNEGGNHDTRMCYLGESRLSRIEGDLPDGSFILGIDEHTGLTLDLDADTAEVFGKGVVTLREGGESRTIPAGVTIPIDVLRNAGRDGLEAPRHTGSRGRSVAPANADQTDQTDQTDQSDDVAASLAGEVAKQESAFDAAIAARDADGCVGAILAVDQAIVDWSSDTNQSDDVDRARVAMRSMVVRLGAIATEGIRDPRDVMSPVVDAVLALRSVVREEKRYDLSDLIRDEMAKAKIEVRDTPDGVEWLLE